MPDTPHSLQTIPVRLDYPTQQVKEPILYHLVRDYRLVPNILRARIDIERGGMLEMKLTGKPEDLQAGTEYLRGLGITITHLE